MKKLALLVATVSVLGIGQSAVANEQPTVPNPSTQPSATVPNSVIDGIEVPYDVLMNVQMDHQGYAVTKASKYTRNNEVTYVLQVSRDTLALPHESIFLLYNKDWQPVGQQSTPPAPVRIAPKPAQKPVEPAAPAPAQAPAAEIQKPEGGRGGGQTQVEENNDNGNVKPDSGNQRVKPGNGRD